MSDPVLEISRLEVRYGSVRAVRGLDLSIGSGEAVGLIGPNGAGKTTTLMAIMGAVPIHSGDIKFKGGSLIGLASESIARSGIALVPEGRQIFGEFSVAENLRLGILGRRSEGSLQKDLEWVHSLFPVVAQYSKRAAGQLSGGQQQQLAIARALISNPDVLLLDEPSLGLAPTVVDDLFESLDQIRDRGVTILIVEQRAQLAVEFADRSIVLRNGEVALTASGEERIRDEQIAAAYFGS